MSSEHVERTLRDYRPALGMSNTIIYECWRGHRWSERISGLVAMTSSFEGVVSVNPRDCLDCGKVNPVPYPMIVLFPHLQHFIEWCESLQSRWASARWAWRHYDEY